MSEGTTHSLQLNGLLPESRTAVEQFELALLRQHGGSLIVRAATGKRRGVEAVFVGERLSDTLRSLGVGIDRLA